MIPRVVIIAPAIYPLGRDGYGGIERLCSLFLKGLVEHGVKTSCVCSDGSILPRGVTRYSSGQPRMDFHELGIQICIQDVLDLDTVFLDFSHSKWLGRLYPEMKQMGIIWHDPKIMQPPQPKYNVVALSQWQADRFREVYQQGCIVFDPHCADEVSYSDINWAMPEQFAIFIGKMGPDKGCLSAIALCRQAGTPLVIIGASTPGDPPSYVNQVKQAADGKGVIYLGETTDSVKWLLMSKAECLVYPVSYPPGFGEASSHKMAEAIFAGLPCIAFRQGGMEAVIEDGLTGFLVDTQSDFVAAIGCSHNLDRESVKQRGRERWYYKSVIARWLPLLEKVACGVRW